MNKTVSKVRSLIAGRKVRISLRSFLLVLCATGLLLGYVLNRSNELNEKRDFVKSLDGQSTISIYCDSNGIRKPFQRRTVVRKIINFSCFPFCEISNVNLSASRRMVDGDIKAIVQNLPNVKRLNLSNTQISDKGIRELVHLKKLLFVDLSGTEVTDSGKKHLASAMPTVRIKDDSASRDVFELIQKTLSEKNDEMHHPYFVK